MMATPSSRSGDSASPSRMCSCGAAPHAVAEGSGASQPPSLLGSTPGRHAAPACPCTALSAGCSWSHLRVQGGQQAELHHGDGSLREHEHQGDEHAMVPPPPRVLAARHARLLRQGSRHAREGKAVQVGMRGRTATCRQQWWSLSTAPCQAAPAATRTLCLQAGGCRGLCRSARMTPEGSRCSRISGRGWGRTSLSAAMPPSDCEQ
jgi:hypothetical protein